MTSTRVIQVSIFLVLLTFFFSCKKDEDSIDIPSLGDYRQGFIGMYQMTDSVFQETAFGWQFLEANTYELYVFSDDLEYAEIGLENCLGSNVTAYGDMGDSTFSLSAQETSQSLGYILSGTGGFTTNTVSYEILTSMYKHVGNGVQQ